MKAVSNSIPLQGFIFTWLIGYSALLGACGTHACYSLSLRRIPNLTVLELHGPPHSQSSIAFISTVTYLSFHARLMECHRTETGSCAGQDPLRV